MLEKLRYNKVKISNLTIFSRYFLLTELCLAKNETHIANYATFKVVL